jgi:hypothetical protein
MNKQAISVKGLGYRYAGKHDVGRVVIDGNVCNTRAQLMAGCWLSATPVRQGVPMKGIDIVVHGNIGHMSVFSWRNRQFGRA